MRKRLDGGNGPVAGVPDVSPVDCSLVAIAALAALAIRAVTRAAGARLRPDAAGRDEIELVAAGSSSTATSIHVATCGTGGRAVIGAIVSGRGGGRADSPRTTVSASHAAAPA
jgi:hypothetical protein